MDKDKKKTLTISSNLKKKIDTSSLSPSGKKSFAVKKKEPFRGGKLANSYSQKHHSPKSSDPKKKILLENLLSNKPLKLLLKKMTSQQEKAN